MTIFSKSTIVAALVAVASARRCQDITVPATISARNAVLNQSIPSTAIEAANFVLNITQPGHNYTQDVTTGYATVSGSYKLAATFCEPDSASSYGHGRGHDWQSSGNVIQILTHGLGFDRRYWDLSYQDYNYSYVEEAVDKYGYSTLTWDRLGVGMSSHGQPINEIQAYLEVAALKALTLKVRNGRIPGIRRRFRKIVHVGHSFGSQHNYLLTAMDPSISDGIVQTGWSQNGTYVPYFAFGANFVPVSSKPALASEYADGYIANGDATGFELNFLAPNQFDAGMLSYAYGISQPITPGELLTSAGEDTVPNTYAGPVLVVTGERDIPFCGGNCYNTGTPAYASIPAESQRTFLNTKIEVSIVPNAGHGLTMEYSAKESYDTVFDFLERKGLAP